MVLAIYDLAIFIAIRPTENDCIKERHPLSKDCAITGKRCEIDVS